MKFFSTLVIFSGPAEKILSVGVEKILFRKKYFLFLRVWNAKKTDKNAGPPQSPAVPQAKNIDLGGLRGTGGDRGGLEGTEGDHHFYWFSSRFRP